MQVEHTADCFGGAWFKSPLSTEVWHLRHIWRETAFQFAEVLAFNGETYVVSVNEFSATYNWQVVGVQVEQNRCKDRALRKAVTLGSPRTGVTAHVHPETSITKQQTNQFGEPIWHAFTQFVKKTSVPESVICCFKSRKTATYFNSVNSDSCLLAYNHSYFKADTSYSCRE